MNLDDTKIVPILTQLFQKNVTIELGDKKIKEGTFVLFKQNGSYIQLYITHAKKEMEVIEVPYPMIIKKDENKLIFDYNCKYIAKTNSSNELAAKILATALTRNKFYNTTLTITVI